VTPSKPALPNSATVEALGKVQEPKPPRDEQGQRGQPVAVLIFVQEGSVFVLKCFGALRAGRLSMRRSWTPSIVPNGADQTVYLTVYLVVDDYGRLGRAFCETDVERSNLEAVISDLMSGQYRNPVRVVAFNTTERWSEDVSGDVVRDQAPCRSRRL
jgi:hypothetical protein